MIVSTAYLASNWYWVAGGSTTVVWASARFSYVPVTDATYVAWLAAGNAPTIIDTPLNLGGVMQAQVLPRLFAQGINIASTGTPALNGQYALDDNAQGNITSLSTGIAAGKPIPGGGSTFSYSDASGASHAFAAAQFLNFAQAAEDYIYNTVQALGANLAGTATAMPSASMTIA